MGIKKYNYKDTLAVQAKDRVPTIIDQVPPEDLVQAIKEAPSLRGMILGYVAELMFERHLPQSYDLIVAQDIESPDDHDRQANKSDRTVTFKGKQVRIQLKSIQTNSIARELSTGVLRATV